jgi:hypothetical protein
MAEVSPGPKRNETRDDNDRRGPKSRPVEPKQPAKNPGLELMQIPTLCMARGGGDDSSQFCSNPSRHETIN